MPVLPKYFARTPDGINLQDRLVVIVGLGMVGSPIAKKLARSTVGRLRLIDDDLLKHENLARHELPVEYLGWNKAEGLAVYLAAQIENLHAEAIPRKIDQSVSDELLDQWLADADLIVAATDDRVAQRRIGRRALQLGISGIFPALYPRAGGGEIVVQLDPLWPCFGCWDYFRRNTEQLRGVNALEIAADPVVNASVRLSIGILDRSSEHRNMMVQGPGEPPNQLFRLDRVAMLRRGSLPRRPDCPTCHGGPRTATRLPSTQPGWQTASGSPKNPPRSRPALGATTPEPSSWHVGQVIGAGLAVTLLVLIIAIASNSSSPPGRVSAAYRIHVDYSHSLQNMVVAAGLTGGESHGDVTEANFPITRGPQEVTVGLIQLTKLKVDPDVGAGIGSDPREYTQWLSDLSKLGYRPASLPELLAFVLQFPTALRGLNVVELGTLNPTPPDMEPGYVYAGIANGQLESHSTGDDGFDEIGYRYRFLAVRR